MLLRVADGCKSNFIVIFFNLLQIFQFLLPKCGTANSIGSRARFKSGTALVVPVRYVPAAYKHSVYHFSNVQTCCDVSGREG